jgi:hypothetical protein
MGRHRERVKAIDAVPRRGPDVALVVLEQPVDTVSRKTVRAREDLRSPAMNMQQPGVASADPEAAVLARRRALTLNVRTVPGRG